MTQANTVGPTRPPRSVDRSFDDGIVTLTLHRGEHNALTSALTDELRDALRACDADPAVRAVVLTGAGSSFSVGADLNAGDEPIPQLLAGDGAHVQPDYREPASRVTLTMLAMTIPVIAALNGDAIGGGATITLAADLRIAAESARLGFPFTRLGLCPEGASTYLLPRLVGPARAAEWLLSGRLVPAGEAHEAGLVSALLPAADVVSAAHALAHDIVDHTSAAAVAATRALLHANSPNPDAAAASESRMIVQLATGPDCAEGTAAFLQRRRPRFGPRATTAP